MTKRAPRGWLILAVDWWPLWVSALVLLGYGIRFATGHAWTAAAVLFAFAAVFAALAGRNLSRNTRRGYFATRRELLTAARLLPLDVLHINWESNAGLVRTRFHIGYGPVTVVVRFPEGASGAAGTFSQFVIPWWQVRVLHYIRATAELGTGRPGWRQRIREIRAIDRMTRTGAVYAEAHEITELCEQIRGAEPSPADGRPGRAGG